MWNLQKNKPSRLSGEWREGSSTYWRQVPLRYLVAAGADMVELAFLGEDLQVMQGVVIININKFYHSGMLDDDIYSATRSLWAIAKWRIKHLKKY